MLYERVAGVVTEDVLARLEAGARTVLRVEAFLVGVLSRTLDHLAVPGAQGAEQE